MLLAILLSRDLHAEPIGAVQGFPLSELILQFRSVFQLPPFAVQKRGDVGGYRPSPLRKRALMLVDKAIMPTWLVGMLITSALQEKYAT